MASAARQRSLIVPREHGAWGILLIPLLTGGCVGFLAAGSARNFAPLGIAALSLFWLRTPVESWAGTTPVRVRTAGEMKLVRNAVLILAAVSIGALIWLFWGGRNRALLGIGAIAGTSFLIQAILKRAWQKARTVAQMIGAAGLTSTAPAAYYVATGQWDGNAWSLWAANLLFAVNQIHFVQLRIHAAQIKTAREKLLAGRWFLAGQFISIAMLASACALHLFRWYAAAAFLPILFRGSAWFAATPQPLAIHTLGKSELLYACAFGVLLVLGIRLR
jgi:YwiC-like protein